MSDKGERFSKMELVCLHFEGRDFLADNLAIEDLKRRIKFAGYKTVKAEY